MSWIEITIVFFTGSTIGAIAMGLVATIGQHDRQDQAYHAGYANGWNAHSIEEITR